jgi:hypothetical protein
MDDWIILVFSSFYSRDQVAAVIATDHRATVIIIPRMSKRRLVKPVSTPIWLFVLCLEPSIVLEDCFEGVLNLMTFSFVLRPQCLYRIQKNHGGLVQEPSRSKLLILFLLAIVVLKYAAAAEACGTHNDITQPYIMSGTGHPAAYAHQQTDLIFGKL